MPEFLSTAEFARWANGHDEKVARLLDLGAAQSKDITGMKVDIAILKTTHIVQDRRTDQRKGLVRGAVAAAAGAIAGALTGWF